MKKTLVSALTTALVVGAASTTFAAANPFEDVAADHWAYDAVAQLAADGVIEGYGDGTYRGDQEITRYEMAQMVARAMAKNGVSAADKAMIDKLAAEFADELNALGVRVAALEKKIDNVKWHGLMRYTYDRTRKENDPDHTNTNDFRLRLMMDAKVNEHWTGKARIEYKSNMDTAKNSTGADGNIYLNRAYVEGTYGATVIDLGRFPAFSTVDGGMVFDDEMSGGQVVFGNKAQLKLFAGRYHNHDEKLLDDKTFTLMGIEVDTDRSKKFTAGAAYYHLANEEAFKNVNLDGKDYNAKKASIWEVGLGYRFDKNFALNGAYAQNTSGDIESKHRRAWSAQLDYKGAKLNQVGSFGLYAAYRHIGNYAVL
ncbi:MAG: porin, partial [Schwartzia sp.]|nr:porin [Schwartzia sp. (in: firmicutes)]